MLHLHRAWPLLLTLLWSPLPGWAGEAATADRVATVWAIVDACADGGTVEEAVQRLEEAEVSPAELGKLLREGRPLEDQEADQRTLSITDAYGRTTEVLLTIPRRYDPDRPAGVLFCLHGLNGHPRDVQPMFYTFAQGEGMLLVCPTARTLPTTCTQPDAEILKQLPQLAAIQTHWWSYCSGDFVLTTLRRLGREFRIDHDHVILSGYSMGGFGTWNIGMRFHDRFAALVPVAGGISVAEYLGTEDTTMRSLLPNLVGKPLYFIHGDADDIVPVSFDRRSDEILRGHRNRSHTYVEVPGGGHILQVHEGGALMRDLQKWLKAPRRDPTPKQVEHHALDADHGAAYWLSIDALAGAGAQIEGRVRGGTRVDVKCEQVAQLSVWLNEDLVRMQKSITVKVNGKQHFKGKVTPSLQALLESWRLREDPALLHDARLQFTLEE